MRRSCLARAWLMLVLIRRLRETIFFGHVGESTFSPFIRLPIRSFVLSYGASERRGMVVAQDGLASSSSSCLLNLD